MVEWGDAQLEERVCDLQHQNVWMVVLVAHQDTLASAAHAMFFVVFLQSLQTRQHRRILFRLLFFGTKGVIAEREEADGRRLVRVKSFGEGGPVFFTSLLEKFAPC